MLQRCTRRGDGHILRNVPFLFLNRLKTKQRRSGKKKCYGWSDKGATKIARIILKRFTNAKAWEDYWQEKMQAMLSSTLEIINVFHKIQDNN